MTWATGDSVAQGLNAFMLPGCLGITFVWLTAAIYKPWVAEDRGPAWLGGISMAFAGLGVFFTFLAFWVWFFMRPRFLVPPHLRDQPGRVKSAWMSRRSERQLRRKKTTGPPEHRA